jgi:uncharacterized membrane protein
MNLTPLLQAPLVVKIHVATVIPAFFIGTWLIFLSRKGTTLHRAGGTVYFALMVATSITAIFVRSLSPDAPFFGFSPIHLLIPLTLYGLYGVLRGALSGNIAMHRRAVFGTYFGALIIAGGFTLLPGRIMHSVFFGS